MFTVSKSTYRPGTTRPACGPALGGLLALLLSSLLLSGSAHAQATSHLLWGYVFNYAGALVPGATVTLYTEPAHVAAGPVVTTDAQGQWRMDAGTGTFAVRATAPGYDFSEQTVYATSSQTGITFILRQVGAPATAALVATISGRVISADGVPLGGINIVANDRLDTGVRQVQQPPTLSAAVTNADGMYALEVPAGAIWLTLKSGAVWGYQLKPVNVNPGDHITGADFVPAIRVLPRTALPAATPLPVASAVPTPLTEVAPQVGIGMPNTGNSGGAGLWAALATLGLLCTAAGWALAEPLRRRG